MGLDLVFRFIMMIIYAVCISSLSKRLKSFPEDAMRAEVRSIKLQFLSFFIGYIIEEIFEIYELVTLNSNFAVASVKTFVIIVGFVQPVVHMLYSHHKTFRGISDKQDVLVP